MCGIAGIVADRTVNRAAIERMTEIQADRGPDDSGTWYSADGRIGLGHRRLSIIDPSPAGRQPMADRDGRHVICFNGEIYNYLELADRLSSPLTKSALDTSGLV